MTKAVTPASADFRSALYAQLILDSVATGNGPSGYHRTEPAGIGPLAPATPPYGPMCRNPDACAGKGYCVRNPNCGE